MIQPENRNGTETGEGGIPPDEKEGRIYACQWRFTGQYWNDGVS